MNVQFWKFGVFFALATILLSGCGGGGGGSGSDNNPPPPGGGPVGGDTRTGRALAIGPITGFGSVIVNGNTYATNASTTFSKDGLSAIQADFTVGQMVLIQGTINDDNTNAVATSVEFNDNVEGPVSSVDSLNKILVVLGQTVQITASTSLDDSCPALLDDYVNVAAVEVSGPVLANGAIEATRIECKNAAAELEVTGAVSGLNTGTTTFMINALQVNYGAAMMQDFPAAGISNGDPVEAKDSDGGGLGASGELLATSVEYKGNQFAQNEGDHIETEGFITRFISATDFDVSGIPVTTTGTTVYEGGAAGDLGMNLKVEAEGEFNSAGVLVATKIEIKASTAVRVTGLVDSVTGDTLQILGITITTDTVKTRFEDKLADVDPFRIGDVNTDDYVEIRGQEFPSGEIFAFLLERDDARTRTELRGFVAAGGIGRPDLTVLGVTIQTDASTVFRDSNHNQFQSVDAFWAAVGEGSLIDVNGAETGPQTLLAEEVALEIE